MCRSKVTARAALVVANQLLTPVWKARYIVAADLSLDELKSFQVAAGLLEQSAAVRRKGRKRRRQQQLELGESDDELRTILQHYGTALRSSEKTVLARLADRTFAEKGFASISREELAGDCSLTEEGLRLVLERLLEHRGCPFHLEVQATFASPGCCIACRREFRAVGAVRISRDETFTEARRYAVLLNMLRGDAAYPLPVFENGKWDVPKTEVYASLGANPVAPQGPSWLAPEANPVAPQGPTSLARTDLSHSPDVPHKDYRRFAPADVHEGTKSKERPTIHDDPGAKERVAQQLAETKRQIESRRTACV